jgi:hypothetical protein
LEQRPVMQDIVGLLKQILTGIFFGIKKSGMDIT